MFDCDHGYHSLPCTGDQSGRSLSLFLHWSEHRHMWCAQKHRDQRCSPMTVANLNCIIVLDHDLGGISHNGRSAHFAHTIMKNIHFAKFASFSLSLTNRLRTIGSDKLFQSARATLQATSHTTILTTIGNNTITKVGKAQQQSN
jgi:hypothetical protein